MEYVIPGLAVIILILLSVLLANAHRLRRSGLSMRREIDEIRRQTPQGREQPAVPVPTPVQPERRPPERVEAAEPPPAKPEPAPPEAGPPEPAQATEKTPELVSSVTSPTEEATDQSLEAAIARLYRVNAERLYTDHNGVRVGIVNMEVLGGDQTALPVLSQNPNGAFWILDGRFLVPRPGSLDSLHSMRSSVARLFDCKAEGAGEPPQKNVLVRAALLRTADDGWVLAQRGVIQLAGENDRQPAVEEIVRLYRTDSESLQRRYTIFQFGVTNEWQRKVNPSESPKFGLLPAGPYWLLQRGEKERYAVPVPDLTVDDRLFQLSAFRALFSVTGYQPGRTYRKVELVRPARLNVWDVVETGEVSLGVPEPQPEPEPEAAQRPARRAKPKKSEVPDEPAPVASLLSAPAEMADIFNQDAGLFRERFSPTRYGVKNSRELESKAPPDPTFGPKRNGDYWLVAASLGSSNGYSYAVPYPGIVVDVGTYRHLRKVFRCQGYQAGRRYRRVLLVSPAVVRETPPEGWSIVKTGVLALTGGEPDVDSD